MEEIVLTLFGYVVIYFAGYFKGKADGKDWAIQRVREINDDLRSIYKLMEENTK